MDPNQQPIQTPSPQQPAPVIAPQAPISPAATAADDPGKTLGVVSLITAILGLALVGLVTGIIGLKKSKKAGFKNSMALAGIIISIVFTILFVAIIALASSSLFKASSDLSQKCKELGPGTHYVDGAKYSCDTSSSSQTSSDGSYRYSN
jgi:hypothetical protein